MATIGNNADTLLQGLSDFWLRYFRDLGDLQAAYEGMEILLGQSYLDLCSAVLNQSIRDVPLFNKDFYQLIRVREDQLAYRDTGSSTGWALTTERYGSVPLLQNKVYEPTAALEVGLDYLVNDGELVFLTDPTQPPVQGYAQRPVEVLCGGFFEAEGVDDWATLGVHKGDTLEVMVLGQAARRLTIVHVKNGRLALSVDTPAPTVPAGAPTPSYSWKVLRTRTDGVPVTGLPEDASFTGSFTQPGPLQVYEVALWAVDAQVDDEELHRTFGHLFGGPRVSTESYRTFIRGLMQLYTLGPAVDRIESALNVSAGFEVVRDDGEVLQTYELSGDVQRVQTDRNTYEYAADIPLRTDVKDTAQWGQLTFRAFEPLTLAIQVVDHIKDSTWWHGIVIPAELMPGADELARTAHNKVVPMQYGPDAGWRYGDLNAVYIADSQRVHRYAAAFELMDGYLKHHMFCVRISSVVDNALVEDLKKILREQKPAHTTVFFQQVP